MIRRGPALQRKFARATQGAALVEFSLLLPLLVILMGGVVEITRAVYQYHIVTRSVQDAARFLSRREEVRDMATCASGASLGAAETLARNLALTGSISGGAGYILSHWTDPGTIMITVSCHPEGGMVSPVEGGVPVIEVSATVPFNDVGLIGFFSVDGLSIEASHREVAVGG